MTSTRVAVPSVFDVDRIVAGSEPVVRNLRITYGYYELSQALALRTGGLANWCTFAVWSSKQIGGMIRREHFEVVVGRFLRGAPEAAVLRALLWVLPGQAERLVRQMVMAVARLEVVKDAVAQGNRKVFAEIGREFARFLATFADETAGDERRIAEFCAELRPGDPPDGQRLLRKAFTRYYWALFTDDPRQRAELVSSANREIALHEQIRLQPEVAAALEAPVIDPAVVGRRLLELVLPGDRLRGAVWTVAGPGRVAGELLATYARGKVRHTVTGHLMTLTLPDGQVLEIGISGEIPAAYDWADLHDRMHYITDMFRCYAQRADLLWPPFTAAQAADIRSGRRPAGQL